MIGRVRRAVAATALALTLAGCATFPDEGPRDWRDKVDSAGELGGPPVIPDQDTPSPAPDSGPDSDPSAAADKRVQRHGGGVIARQDAGEQLRDKSGRGKRERGRRGHRNPGTDQRAGEVMACLLGDQSQRAKRREEDDEQHEEGELADAEPGERVAAHVARINVEVEMARAQPHEFDHADQRHQRQRDDERNAFGCGDDFEQMRISPETRAG